MAVRAFDHDLAPAQPRQRSNIVFHPKLVPAARTPLAPLPRRSVLNAAAHEGLVSDIRLAGRILIVACCVGLGLALGIHFDEILHDVRLVAFNAEEPRWLWSVVDSL
jgi:hypothetical protein